MGKRIALDFDDTYTAMPEIWDTFIRACKSAGHTVTIVTARDSMKSMPEENQDIYNADINEVCKRLGIGVVYTYGRQKAEYFSADIWIDDNPDWIPRMELIKSMATMDGWKSSSDDEDADLVAIAKERQNGKTVKVDIDDL